MQAVSCLVLYVAWHSFISVCICYSDVNASRDIIGSAVNFDGGLYLGFRFVKFVGDRYKTRASRSELLMHSLCLWSNLLQVIKDTLRSFLKYALLHLTVYLYFIYLNISFTAKRSCIYFSRCYFKPTPKW